MITSLDYMLPALGLQLPGSLYANQFDNALNGSLPAYDPNQFFGYNQNQFQGYNPQNQMQGYNWPGSYRRSQIPNEWFYSQPPIGTAPGTFNNSYLNNTNPLGFNLMQSQALNTALSKYFTAYNNTFAANPALDVATARKNAILAGYAAITSPEEQRALTVAFGSGAGSTNQTVNQIFTDAQSVGGLPSWAKTVQTPDWLTQYTTLLTNAQTALSSASTLDAYQAAFRNLQAAQYQFDAPTRERANAFPPANYPQTPYYGFNQPAYYNYQQPYWQSL